VSEDKAGREDGQERPSGPDGAGADGELSDEQIDRETPGVEDAEELEEAEAELAEEAEADEDDPDPSPAGGQPSGRPPGRLHPHRRGHPHPGCR
jgi:preprotein translocase subunit SecE